MLAELAYLLVLAALLPFGMHRLAILWLRLRRPEPPTPASWPGELPCVTVQLPVYNEASVVERLIDAVCRLDYPPDLLDIQLLDDSDDETSELAASRIRAWRGEGVDVAHIRRRARDGFKAGALSYGLGKARGGFLLVLDADFIPPADLIRRLLPSFGDPGVGMVQARWTHLNEDRSWITRAQALLLDAHFGLEHAARYRARRFFNFNGTAGMWRRRCIVEAGGWRSTTLTEDLDLSYRAQLAGWRFVYRDDIEVPAELPETLRALEVQQERWAEGAIQTARALLPTIWRSRHPLGTRLEATAHLLGHLVHPLAILLALTVGIGAWAGSAGGMLPAWVHATGLAFALTPFLIFYLATARLRGYTLGRAMRATGAALILGIGLGVPLTGAVLRGLGRGQATFVRTPKRGERRRPRYATSPKRTVIAARLALALLLAVSMVSLLWAGGGLAPFALVLTAGHVAASREAFRSESVVHQEHANR
jgi:cellulose synthase/poly-beta-1,6-N-acetylglucosamine synthase-like glycosyltransferase